MYIVYFYVHCEHLIYLHESPMSTVRVPFFYRTLRAISYQESHRPRTSISAKRQALASFGLETASASRATQLHASNSDHKLTLGTYRDASKWVRSKTNVQSQIHVLPLWRSHLITFWPTLNQRLLLWPLAIPPLQDICSPSLPE